MQLMQKHLNRENLKNSLIKGDTLKVLRGLPDDIVDLGVTSPPYNKKEKNKGWLVKNVVYSEYVDKVPEDKYQSNQVKVLNEIYRVTNKGGSFFYNHKIRWEDGEMFHPMDWLRKTDWVVKQEIVWDRTIAANIRGWRFWQVDERIYWLYKPVNSNKKGKELLSKDAKLTSVWRAVPENKNPHPAPFPLWLPARIIISLMHEKQGVDEKQKGLVLDPYLGSGTTAVAAKLLGYDYLGIDIGKEYIDYAEKRILNAESERSIVKKELELHKVFKTFKERKQKGENTGKYTISNSYTETDRESLSLFSHTKNNS